MRLTFDYYNNLEQVDLWLCNPDGRELFSLPGRNRNFTLRFNDLSELTFEVDSSVTLPNGAVTKLDAYDYLQVKRLVFATNIGWFQISNVDEHDVGTTKYKLVKAESYQTVLKNKGFLSEERVYCFYNPNDPYDDRYDPNEENSIPSVLGQLNKQLGIQHDLSNGLAEPAAQYTDWTVTYIHPSLEYRGTGSICRTFKENTTYGYDWIMNDVEKAFGVVVIFDFLNKAIHFRIPVSEEEALEGGDSQFPQRTNVVYTFSNFMKSVDVTESAEDIVTVLNCNGNNCNIIAVNPTGTNYICDFSYYMDKINHRWMSEELIEKLEDWKSDCDAAKTGYAYDVEQLRNFYRQKTEYESKLKEISLTLQDLKNIQGKRNVLGSGTQGELCGVVAVEKVLTGEKSVNKDSAYNSVNFAGYIFLTAYKSAPTYDSASKRWIFSGESKNETADKIIKHNLSGSNSSADSYWYFSDDGGISYCKLLSAATVNKDAITNEHYCKGFDRYIAYCYPKVVESTGATFYTDNVQDWIDIRETQTATINTSMLAVSSGIHSLTTRLKVTSSRLNILRYFFDTPILLRELSHYWIEGDYTNDHIAVLDSTTPAEEIELANELMELGYTELSKVSQPRLSFSIESINAMKQYEFKDQMRDLELGKIIAVEKDEGLWYYPALLAMSFNLDSGDEFSMEFANATRLDDWGYTYADLIASASSTSRQVSANWQNLTSYTKDRDEIASIIQDPLDATRRAAYANMTNQEFVIDHNGIHGRKKLDNDSEGFEDEQVRLINNVLIFTDDNWKTAKAALGKIYYSDDDGNHEAYGLIADTVIGSLIMGKALQIRNPKSTITIGESGIIIKKPVYDDGGELIDYAPMFTANAETGDLTITGTVTALKGYIGNEEKGFVINDSYISNGKESYSDTKTGVYVGTDGIGLGAGKFYVKEDGYMYAQSGNIGGWVLGSEEIYRSSAGINASDTHVKASLVTKGGTSPVRFYCGNGNRVDGKFVVLDDGSLYASAAYISGNINAQSGYIGDWLIVNGSLSSGTNTETSSSLSHYKLAIYGQSSGSSIIMPNQLMLSEGYGMAGTHATFTSDGIGYNLYSAAGGMITPSYVEWSKVIDVCSDNQGSDIRIKNSIESLNDNYEQLFNLLSPKRYKYNNGTSGRYHTGFIAQEVVAALEEAQLDTLDFAAVMLENPGLENECWYLRRDEFVALNTWQIQKLKKRISELESVVNQLTNKE